MNQLLVCLLITLGNFTPFVYRTSLKMGRLIAMEHTYTVKLKEWDCGFYKTFGGVFHRIGEIG